MTSPRRALLSFCITAVTVIVLMLLGNAVTSIDFQLTPILLIALVAAVASALISLIQDVSR